MRIDERAKRGTVLPNIERNVMVSGEGKFVRLAVRSREDNDKLLKVLSAL